MKSKKTSGDMHEVENRRSPRAVKDKKRGLRIEERRKLRQSTKLIVCIAAALVMLVGVCGFGSEFLNDADRNAVSTGYGSVSERVKKGETYRAEAGYSAIDIFARLNWTFAQQPKWYSSMQSVVKTVVKQEISTFKQFDNGILISADLTRSSVVNGAKQFCYLKDRDIVMWRDAAGKPSTYDGLNTVWKDGTPNRMPIYGQDGFIAKNGLPAYELSVYVIDESTVSESSEVILSEDGLYRITYKLKPDTWEEEGDGEIITKGATAYYANQMIFSGGLSEAPTFESISVTYYFDETWQVHKAHVEESYRAKYGPITAGCKCESDTFYEYGTENAESKAYSEYFAKYAD